jgi:hypothetical protein
MNPMNLFSQLGGSRQAVAALTAASPVLGALVGLGLNVVAHMSPKPLSPTERQQQHVAGTTAAYQQSEAEKKKQVKGLVTGYSLFTKDFAQKVCICT